MAFLLFITFLPLPPPTHIHKMTRPTKRKTSKSHKANGVKRLKQKDTAVRPLPKETSGRMFIVRSSSKIQLKYTSRNVKDVPGPISNCISPIKNHTPAKNNKQDKSDNKEDEINNEITCETKECRAILQDYFHDTLEQHRSDMHALIEKQRVQVETQLEQVKRIVDDIVHESTFAQTQDVVPVKDPQV